MDSWVFVTGKFVNVFLFKKQSYFWKFFSGYVRLLFYLDITIKFFLAWLMIRSRGKVTAGNVLQISLFSTISTKLENKIQFWRNVELIIVCMLNTKLLLIVQICKYFAFETQLKKFVSHEKAARKYFSLNYYFLSDKITWLKRLVAFL